MISWIVAGLGVAGGLFGSGALRNFERLAADDIGTRLEGDAKFVRVRVGINGILDGSLTRATIEASRFSVKGLPLFTEPNRSRAGKIKKLEIRLTDFELRNLHVETLTADVFDCRYDFGLALREKKVRLSESGVGPGYVRVTAKSLEHFLLRKYKEIKRISVELENDKVYVKGFGDFLLASAEFEVSAGLEIRNGSQLWLRDSWVFLNGRPVRDGSDRALLQVLNPVLDINEDLQLFDAIKMERIRSKNGVLEIWGTATIPQSSDNGFNPIPPAIL